MGNSDTSQMVGEVKMTLTALPWEQSGKSGVVQVHLPSHPRGFSEQIHTF